MSRRGNPGGFGSPSADKRPRKRVLTTQATGTGKSKAPPPTSVKPGAPSGHRGNPKGNAFTSKPTQSKTASGYTRTPAATPRKPGPGKPLP